MLKDNLKLLDIDEPIREIHTAAHQELLTVCKKYGLTLDLASSDVVMYIEDKYGNYIGID